MLWLATKNDGAAPVDVTSAANKRATLALLLSESFHHVRFQTEKMQQLKAELSSTESQLIDNQKWVITYQSTVAAGRGTREIFSREQFEGTV